MAQRLIGTAALMAPFWVVEAADWPVVNPSEEAAAPKSPIALYSAVIGMLMVPIAPSWSIPTEVVEQLLFAPARRPMDSEHALIGASRLISGDDWVVVFVPLSAFWPGSNELPISFASNVIGSDKDNGSAVNGESGLGPLLVVDLGVLVTDECDAGVELGAGAGVGVAAGDGVVSVVAAWTFCTVDEVAFDAVAAPAMLKPARTLAAARIRLPVTTANEV
jgi:hypothetical protein